MRIRYTRPALDDLAAILDYVQQRSPAGAGRIRKQIRAAVDLVAEHPGLGTRTTDPGIRWIAATSSSLVFFEVDGKEEIIVHAVRYGSRNSAGWDPRRE